MAEPRWGGTPEIGVSDQRLPGSSTAVRVCLTAACQAAAAPKESLHAMQGYKG